MADGPYVRRLHVQRDDQFTKIANDWVRDERLTHRAFSILANILSHRDGYRVTVESLRRRDAGRDAVLGALRDLRELGYLALIEFRDKGRIVGREYVTTDPDHPVDAEWIAEQTDGGQLLPLDYNRQAGKRKTPRSEPETAQPDQAGPDQAGPDQAQPDQDTGPYKKNKEKNTNIKNNPPAPSALAPPAESVSQPTEFAVQAEVVQLPLAVPGAELDLTPAPPVSAVATKQARQMPEGWLPSQHLRDWAMTRWPADWVRKTHDLFVLDARKNGRRYKDWDAAWRNWVEKEDRFNPPRTTGGAVHQLRPGAPPDRSWEASRAAAAELDEQWKRMQGGGGQ